MTHETVATILRRRSTHPDDIHEVAFAERDLSGVRRVLDLGCGFGAWAEAVAPLLPAGSGITGIDVWPDNEMPFTMKVMAGGCRPTFVAAELRDTLPFDDGAFDLVISGYTLYFFPGLLAEVVRVLSESGRFLAVTHYEASVRGILEQLGLSPDAAPWSRWIRHFCAENGESVLRERFNQIERIDYANQVAFSADRDDQLDMYLRFKLPFLIDGVVEGDPLPASLWSHAQGALQQAGQLVLDKRDAIFWCKNAR